MLHPLPLLWLATALTAVPAHSQSQFVVWGPEAPAAEVEIPDLPWEMLETAKLIEHLPEAGEEMYFDASDRQWKEHPASAEFEERMRRALVTPDEWRRALRETRVIATHAHWPADRRFAVSIQTPEWLGQRGYVVVTPRLPGGEQVTVRSLDRHCALAGDAQRAWRRYIEVAPSPPRDVQEVVYDVEVRGASRRAKWTDALHYPLKVVASEEAAMEPVRDPAYDEAVLGAVRISVGETSGSDPQIRVWLNVRRTPVVEPWLKESVCRPVVEFLDGDEVVDRVVVDVREAPSGEGLWHSYFLEGLSEAVRADEELLGRLRVRLSGDPKVAFDDLRRDRYWDGEVVRALVEMMVE